MSQLDESTDKTKHTYLESFFQHLPTPVSIGPDTRLHDVLDSLSFLDFFLFLEATFPAQLSLEDVAVCHTIGDVYALLSDGKREVHC